MPRRDHRLNRRGSEGLDHAKLVRQLRVVAELDGQHLGIDRGGVDLARRDHPHRPLVKPRFDHATEEAARFAHLHEMVAGQVVAGVGIPVVVGPGSTAQIGKGPHGAVSLDDDIGKVDRTARVAIAADHRRRQQLDRGGVCRVSWT